MKFSHNSTIPFILPHTLCYIHISFSSSMNIDLATQGYDFCFYVTAPQMSAGWQNPQEVLAKGASRKKGGQQGSSRCGDRRPQREPGAATDALGSPGRHTASPPNASGPRATPHGDQPCEHSRPGQWSTRPPLSRDCAHGSHEAKKPEQGRRRCRCRPRPPSPCRDVGCASKASITRAGSVTAPYISVTISGKS